MMLIRSTWTITVAEATTLPRGYGLELAKYLHQQLGLDMGSEAMPSTTCSGLVGAIAPSGDFITLHPDQFYHLSLSGLNEPSSKAIANLFRNAETQARLELLGARLQLINREDETSSYDQLYHSLIATEPEPIKRFELKFLTPTAFAQDQLYLPLPLPHLMVRSWLERWNHFAPVYLGGDELVGYLASTLALTRHRIQTRSFTVHRGRITGFTGDVALQMIARPDPLLANVANLLIHYARFAGTGMKTRLGMGQTRIRYV